MHWRLESLTNLRSKKGNSVTTISQMMDAEQQASTDGLVDNMFLNEPSRIAFNIMRGYPVCQNNEDDKDASILMLARADAWMTLALQKIQISSKGGTRSNESAQSYELLVPCALDAIVKDVWEDI